MSLTLVFATLDLPSVINCACSFHVVAEKILARDPAEEIRRAFQLFDDDNTGKISKKNLKRVVRELNETLDDDELYVFPIEHRPLPIHTGF